ncbi:helix-turn-helix domain-containing protein [Aureibaculum luteum]|uniref:helix-turn-helix domain-containing protein n=1 Tax=Aureibaculum luteum TaxID=1548456 RepID=UPI000E54C5D9|nr:helix-turn-helix domain-containing protein [Aureibaculum luteum]
MNRFSIFKILFFFFGIAVFSQNDVIGNTSVAIDSSEVNVVNINYNPGLLNHKNAQVIVDSYNTLISQGNDVNMSNEEIKELAYSHAILKDIPNSTKFIEIYIRKSNDVDVLNQHIFDSFRDDKAFITVSDKFAPMYEYWVMIYLYTGLIGLFIAFVINFKKSEDRIANLLISLFILFSSLFIIHVCIYITNIQVKFPHSLFSTFTLNFLYGPLLYFYIRRISDKYKFKTLDLLHLVPFVFMLIYFMKYYVLPVNDKLNIIINHKEWEDPFFYYSLILKAVSLTIYGILTLNEYLKFKKNNEHNNITLWIRNVVVLNGAFVISQLIFLIVISGLLTSSYYVHPQLITLSIVIMFVGYSAYVQPSIFTNQHRLTKIFNFKYEKSRLNEELSNELKNELLNLFYKEKVYKVSDISLKKLSERLGTDRHSTSQVINEHFKMNFFTLINMFRIKEAQDIFNNDESGDLSIIDVAYDVGYNNKVTFNKAFKKETNLTPSQYRSTLLRRVV